MRLRAVLVFFALVAAPAAGLAARPDALEYAVKANYLYKLAPFVTWPAGAFEGPASPFVICVVGDDPFGPLLDQAVAGQSVGGRPVGVRRLEHVDAAVGCHVLYDGGDEAEGAEALSPLREAPVLTVTDDRRKHGRPGIVHFLIRNNRVRFRIDVRAAAAAGLMISSKLLSLAVDANPTRGTP